MTTGAGTRWTWPPAWRPGASARTDEYRHWHLTKGYGACCDVDQVEYDPETGRPFLISELCVADSPPGSGFLNACIHKVSVDRPQGRVLRYMARVLRVPLLLVAYCHGELETMGVWVCRVDGDRAPDWRQMPLAEYDRRLRQLRQQATLQRHVDASGAV